MICFRLQVARSKTRQKKDKRNIKLVVILVSRVSKRTNFDSYQFQQSNDASKIIMLLFTRWLQELTISYLIGLFEIMIMPKRNIFLARLRQINPTVVLFCALKIKEISG